MTRKTTAMRTKATRSERVLLRASVASEAFMLRTSSFATTHPLFRRRLHRSDGTAQWYARIIVNRSNKEWHLPEAVGPYLALQSKLNQNQGEL